MTANALRELTCKDLAQLAKKGGVRGWHSMRKEELIRALLLAARRKSRRSSDRSTGKEKRSLPVVDGRSAKEKRLRDFQSAQKLVQSLGPANRTAAAESTKDALILMVRDPFWLHASWELSRQSLERAAAALDRDWHRAQPVLRLFAGNQSAASKTVENVVRDIPIHGKVNNWYIDVTDPPSTFLVKIGYSAGDRFYCLATSNAVTTRPREESASLDENWRDIAQQCDKIYAMSGGLEDTGDADQLRELFEERLRRPMGSPLVTRYGIGADEIAAKNRALALDVESELLIYGTTDPKVQLTFRGQPIEIREDGSFTVRVRLEDGRQVMPISATRTDGTEQKTVVVAVERNTKSLEPVVREIEDIVGA
tara:strand:- start:237 stop:1337 length:1101 start_codon:yes stop_codon:yes gene_type:complete